MVTEQVSGGDELGSRIEQIVAAGRRCFSHYGVQKTSMDDIAREAGLTRASVYRYFPTKNALVKEVTQGQTKRFLDEVTRRTARIEGLSAQIEEIARMTIEFMREEPINVAMARSDPDAIARVLTTNSSPLMADSMETIVPLIEAAVARGEVRPDLDVLRAAEWITRIVYSLVLTPAVTFDGDDPAMQQAFIREFLVPGLD
jgi:AcrR family transcriptional regulator